MSGPVLSGEPALSRGPVLSVTGLSASFGRLNPVQVLHGVDIEIGRGEILGLIGETGSGKTTTARAILGAVRADAGTVTIDGQEILGLSRRGLRAFRRRGTAQYVFQDPLRSLDPDHTIGRSVAEGLVASGVRDRREIQERVAHSLITVGLDPDLSSRLPAELSGGQRQRVSLARAMVLDPKLLICDEPVSALDAASRVHVLELLRDLADRSGVAILLITHDLGSLAGIGDRTAVLFQGRVVESGPVESVLTNPVNPYTRLLVASVPTINGEPVPPALRSELRDEVEKHFRPPSVHPATSLGRITP